MTSRKEWLKDETLNLIASYEQYQILWNARHVDYKNRDKKNKLFNEFGAKFECSVEEIQRKIHNLRNQMSQELKRPKKKKSGSGTDEVETSNWPYFGALKFLIPSLTVKATKSSHTQASMVIEEKTTGEQENTTAETVNESPLRKKRSREDNEDNLYKSALKSLQKEPDDFDKFGQYVALELKSLKSDINKGRLKSEIRKIIVRIADEDLYFGPSTSSTSVPSTSSTPVPSTVSTPMPSPAFQSTPEYQSCRDYVNTFTYTDM